MTIRFTPIFDRVLIDRVDSGLKKKASKAGIILPDTVDDKYKASQGVLVMCGDSCDDEVKEMVGKEILFARFAGDEIILNGKEYVLATDRDIYGEISNDTDSK